MICVSISSLRDLKLAVAQGVEMLELRMDLLKADPEQVWGMIPDGIPTIATCRPGAISRDERMRILSTCIRLGASCIDVELEEGAAFKSALIALARKHNCEVIISYHHYESTPAPAELEDILRACYEAGADIAKLATRVNKETEAAALLGLYRLPGRKVILGMGNHGRITRLAAPSLGAEFTFASVGKGSETAPGQFDQQQLKDIYSIINRS